MSRPDLIVALGERRYRVERPFGAWPYPAGRVTDVAVDGRGHVFVLLRYDPLTGPADPRVVELDPTGVFVAGWGGEAIADAHYHAFDGAGRLMVVDRDLHEVIVFSPKGERLGGFGARGKPLEPLNHPTDVAAAANGDIFISDGYAGRKVHRFSADGRLLGSWGTEGEAPGEFGEPHAIFVHGDGRVVVVDRVPNRVQVFDADGRVLQVWRGFHRPMGVWGDAAGFTFVTDQTPNLHLFDPLGVKVGTCRPVLNGAHGLHGAPNGDIFLAEGEPSRITRLRLL